MTKTPEEMAEEYIEDNDECEHAGQAWLAGYKAAMNENKPKVQELEANWKFCCKDKARLLNELAAAERAKEQVADVSKVMPQWISVKDRLPDKSPMVLAMCTDGYELAYYGMYGQGWTNTLGTEHLNVTHWQPLPAPPKEEE